MAPPQPRAAWRQAAWPLQAMWRVVVPRAAWRRPLMRRAAKRTARARQGSPSCQSTCRRSTSAPPPASSCAPEGLPLSLSVPFPRRRSPRPQSCRRAPRCSLSELATGCTPSRLRWPLLRPSLPLLRPSLPLAGRWMEAVATPVCSLADRARSGDVWRRLLQHERRRRRRRSQPAQRQMPVRRRSPPRRLMHPLSQLPSPTQRGQRVSTWRTRRMMAWRRVMVARHGRGRG